MEQNLPPKEIGTCRLKRTGAVRVHRVAMTRVTGAHVTPGPLVEPVRLVIVARRRRHTTPVPAPVPVPVGVSVGMSV